MGKEVDAKRFNDINVGRFLDKVFDVGAVRIFKEISMRAVSTFGLDCRHVHFDTTSRNVYGDYEPYGNDPFEITYGHSKDHRPDLKQFLISMLGVDRNVPVFGIFLTDWARKWFTHVVDWILLNLPIFFAYLIHLWKDFKGRWH